MKFLTIPLVGTMARVGLISSLGLATLASAGNHPLTKINPNHTIDMVVSLDWDINAAPPVAEANDTRSYLVDKAYLENEIREFAKLTYQMTEGRQSIGKVYIYSNGLHWDAADIRATNKKGRANAHIGGIERKGLHINMSTAIASGPRPIGIFGKTIAHELGHYVHAVFDEYREMGRLSSTYPGSPLETDTPLDTVMNNHWTLTRYSVREDYANGPQTAQGRMYGASHWDTLGRSTNDDPLPEGASARAPRRAFPVFQSNIPTTVAALTVPASGWENALQVQYMSPNSSVVLVLNTGMAANLVEAGKNALQGLFDASIKAGDKVNFVLYGANSLLASPAMIPFVDALRVPAKGAIGSLQSDNSGGAGLQQALDKSLAVLKDVPITDNPSVVLINDGTVQANVSAFKELGIPVTILSVGDTTANASAGNAFARGALATDALLQASAARAVALGRSLVASSTPGGDVHPTGVMAHQTRGFFKADSKPAEATKDLQNLFNSTSGAAQEVLNDGDSKVALQPGKSFALSTTVGSLETGLKFIASWNDNAPIAFDLKTPDGTSITPTKLPAGVTYTSDDSYGIYTVASVPASWHGNWVSTLTNTGSAPTADAVSQEVMGSTLLAAGLRVFGGSEDDPGPLGAVVELASDLAVIGASVVASVTAPNGTTVTSNLVLRDDGQGADERADDGSYGSMLENLLFGVTQKGDYTIRVVVTNPAGTAKFSTANSLEFGPNPVDLPVPAFQRVVSVPLTVTILPTAPANTTLAKAVALATDNSQQNGTMVTGNVKLFYTFPAFQGNQYAVRTGKVASYDIAGAAFSTALEIQSATGATLVPNKACLDSNAKALKTSCLGFSPSADGSYAVSASSTNNTSGTFAIEADLVSVGQANIDRLLAWAETTYALPTQGATTGNADGYFFKLYPVVKGSLAFKGGDFFYIAAGSNTPVLLGNTDVWLAKVGQK